MEQYTEEYMEEYIEQYKYEIPGSVILDGNTKITEFPYSRHEIEGILSLKHCTSLHHLPECLSVAWDLDVSYSGIETFSETLFVLGNIIGNHSSLRSISNLKRTHADLILSGCEYLEEMPELLVVNGDLDLSYCTRLKKLPSKLLVRGNLNLQGSSITSLPENLLVGGDISLSGTPIKHLPVGLQVGGYLDLSRCNYLRALPSQLYVRTFLNLFDSGVESFTNAQDLHVGGIIVNPAGSLITHKNGRMQAIPNPEDNLMPENLLQLSRVPLDAVFMGNGNFVSYNNELCRIIFSRNDIYVAEDLCFSSSDGIASVLYHGDDGRYRLEYILNLPTDDFANEWFGEAFSHTF